MSELWASASVHARSCVKKTDRRKGRRTCCIGGCTNPNTHFGRANGVALTSGCEWHVMQWVRSPEEAIRASKRLRAAR